METAELACRQLSVTPEQRESIGPEFDVDVTKLLLRTWSKRRSAFVPARVASLVGPLQLDEESLAPEDRG